MSEPINFADLAAAQIKNARNESDAESAELAHLAYAQVYALLAIAHELCIANAARTKGEPS